MNNVELKENKLENLIYEVRGKQVMLDSDLAILYETETKRINEEVKNNPLKFPERYCFKLSKNELENLWSKFSTANIILKVEVYQRFLPNKEFICLLLY